MTGRSRPDRTGLMTGVDRPVRYAIFLPVACLLAGCEQSPATSQDVPANPNGASVAAMRNEIAGVEDRVNRETLTKRLDNLERRIGELEATPEKLDLDLLTKRVEALESKAAASQLADRPVDLPKASARPTAKASANGTD